MRSVAACDLSPDLTARCRPRSLQRCTSQSYINYSPVASLPARLVDTAKQAVKRVGVGLAACTLTGTLLTSSTLALPSDSQHIQPDILVLDAANVLPDDEQLRLEQELKELEQ
ncbi:hypothetical protein ABBQ32_006436 [Trebouxia sp. C0010 RCD-2024]